MTIAYETQITSDNSQDSLCNPTYPIIEIHVSCKNLPKCDIGSESDPMCALLVKQKGKFVQQDSTEVIENNPNPNFAKFFRTYYIFETSQPLRFEIYDIDSKNTINLSKHDFIGYFETDVQYLVTNSDRTMTFDLKNDKKSGNRGQIVLSCCQSKESNVQLCGQIRIEKLKKMKTFAKNNPFFEVSKRSDSGCEVTVYRSKTVKRCYSCTFKEFSIPLHLLMTKSLDDSITISFFDKRTTKGPKIIGKYSSSIRRIMESVGQTFDILDESQKPMGHFVFEKVEVVHVPTFADYLRSGLQLKMITAINYTATNEDPKYKYSYHYISEDPSVLNQYQQCIVSIGGILSKYCKDQMFPVYGFGAKIDHKVSHCFPLTFDPKNPYVKGLNGIMDAYSKSFEKVKLYGPSYISPMIRMATNAAVQNWEKSHAYTVLFIITDNEVMDIITAKDCVVEASDKPLSIIIIGIGKGDFYKLEELDADEHDIKSEKGVRMKRDIVQFVRLRKFRECSNSRFEAELLAELPTQVHEYCSTHGFIPVMQDNDLSI